MPMETARGIIQIESGKNYYWRATRAREPAHSAGSHLRIRGGKEESAGRREGGRGREEGNDGEGVMGEAVEEKKQPRETEEVKWRWWSWLSLGGGNDLVITTSANDPHATASPDDPGVITPHSPDVITLMSISFSSFSPDSSPRIYESHCVASRCVASVRHFFFLSLPCFFFFFFYPFFWSLYFSEEVYLTRFAIVDDALPVFREA